jgi:uncharacterized protein (DUF1778 family)
MATLAHTPKSRRINIRISDAHEDLVRRGAQAKGQSVTEFMVASACMIAEIELAERSEFKLPPDQWKAFLAALDKPAEANPRLQRLLAEPGVVEIANRK